MEQYISRFYIAGSLLGICSAIMLLMFLYDCRPKWRNTTGVELTGVDNGIVVVIVLGFVIAVLLQNLVTPGFVWFMAVNTIVLVWWLGRFIIEYRKRYSKKFPLRKKENLS